MDTVATQASECFPFVFITEMNVKHYHAIFKKTVQLFSALIRDPQVVKSVLQAHGGSGNINIYH
jgi:hypothetical protein